MTTERPDLNGELFTPGVSLRRRAIARVAIHFDKALDRTKQSFKDECDINVLMSRFAKGQPLDHLIRPGGHFGDWSEVPDFQVAQQYIIDAHSLFEQVPANVRERFMNDPARFLAFATDQANADEMRRLGLLKPVQALSPVQAASQPVPAFEGRSEAQPSGSAAPNSAANNGGS